MKKIFLKVCAVVLAVLMCGTNAAAPAQCTAEAAKDNRPYAVRFNCQQKHFFSVKDLTTGKSSKKSLTIVPGHEYRATIKFANYCEEERHLYIYNAKVYAFLPGMIAGGGEDLMYGGMSARNADEKQNIITLKADKSVVLEYVEGSAKIASPGKVNGKKLDGEDLLFWGKGVAVGVDQLNGQLPGTKASCGSVSFRFKAKNA